MSSLGKTWKRKTPVWCAGTKGIVKAWNKGLTGKKSHMFGEKNHQFGKKDELSPRFGRMHTSETKKIMSKKAMGNNNAKGAIRSNEYRLKLSKALKGRIFSDDWKDKLRKNRKGKPRPGNPKNFKHTDKTKKKLKEWYIMHPNKKFSNTLIEQKTAAELERRGFIRNEDFFQNFGIAGIKNVDFYLPKLNTVIECDGCLYHACKKCGFTKYYQDILQRDVKNTKQLKIAGYYVFRFWEHEINSSVEDCLNKIKKLNK